MTDGAERLQDAAFQEALKKRANLRWSFSAALIIAFLVFGICGLYFPDAYAGIMPSTGVPLGLFMGLCLIGLAMLLSVIYIRLVNRIEAEKSG